MSIPIRHRVILALPVLSLLVLGGAASGVIIESGDGSGNTGAPSPDPGWDYVGTRGGLTAVYLGDGWVITANHVGAGDVSLGGVTYPYLTGTAQRLENEDDGTPADLLVFAVSPYPDMPLLPIVSAAPPLGQDLVLVGNGRNRGAATSWDPNGPPPPGPIDGFAWASGRTLRWGTNQVEDYPPDKVLGTWSLATYFDEAGSAHEAQAANGDSGGAAFAFDGDWELAGVIYAIGEYAGQPTDVSLYGQITYVADLASYRAQILDIVSLPEPSGALPAGVMLLGVLARRKARSETYSSAPM